MCGRKTFFGGTVTLANSALLGTLHEVSMQARTRNQDVPTSATSLRLRLLV